MLGRTLTFAIAIVLLAGCAEPDAAPGAAIVAPEGLSTPPALPTPPAFPAFTASAFSASYADEANATRLTLDLTGPTTTFDASGRTVSAYELRERKWLPGNNEEERAYLLSSEGRVVRFEERSCEISAYKQGCQMKPHRFVSFTSAGGVPPHGVAWPEIVEREGDLTSWAHGQRTLLADSAERTEDGVTIRAVVPDGSTQHGTSNATHHYASGRPVPTSIGGLVLREYDEGAVLAGADAFVAPTFAVHPMSVLGPPEWFRGADEAPGPIRMSARDVLADAAKTTPAVSDGRCLAWFTWQSVNAASTSDPSATTTSAYFGIVGEVGTSAFYHVTTSWPDGTVETETIPSPATLHAPSVCDEMRAFGEADASVWGGLSFAKERFGSDTDELTLLGYDALGFRATGMPRAQGWAAVTWRIGDVTTGWNPSCECLTYMQAPVAFFEP